MHIYDPSYTFSQSVVNHKRGDEAIVKALSIEELSEYWSLQSSTGPTKSTWNGRACLAVVCYVLKFCSDSEHDDMYILSDTIRRLEFLALNHRTSRDDLTREKLARDISEMLANYFMPEAKKTFFEVPRLKERFSDLNEILAGFIHFLLQILNTVGDQTFVIKKRYAPLQKELTFLLTYLGDEPFQSTLLEHVEDILLKFEKLANEAGNYIDSWFFATQQVKDRTVSSDIGDLLKKFKLLNANIVEQCLRYENLPICKTPTPENDAIDSLFIVDSLLDDLGNLINHRMEFTDDVMAQTTKLQNLLMSARSFLKGTHTKQPKEFVIQIRDLTYRAEYLINSFVVGNVPPWYLTLRLRNIIQKFELIVEEIKSINWVLTSAYDSNVSSQSTETATVVVGFENVTMKILDELTGGADTLQLISICGMPGLGKTTLAKTLYSDRLVTDRFDILAWCTVSQSYDMTQLLTNLLLNLSSNLDDRRILNLSTEDLGTEIHKFLFGRRYLIVVDDVWESKVWDHLSKFIPDNRNGSRIMLTSRNIDMVPNQCTIHKLHFLSTDQCWELLKKKVFHQPSISDEWVGIGKQIAKQCNGLPLAVVVIAGVLANIPMELGLWRSVIKSLVPLNENPLNIVLELSYKHLPDHLKLCFLYLGAFPEGTEIPIRKLIWLWIAEGFIQKEKDKSLEHVAEEYLMVLINRSLLSITKRRSTGGVKTCTIHDLLRKMCIDRAHKENFMTTIKDHFSLYQKHYRLCIHSKPLAYSRPFGLHCRSFLGHLSDPLSSFSHMKLLRILDLPPFLNVLYSTEVEMKRIVQFFHLRYLVVDSMPQTIAISNLINLEFLRVDSIARIYVPSILLKILKLRHLHLRSEAILEKDYDTSQTNNLQSFSFVRIFDHKDEDILRCSPHLRKLKCICNETLFPDLSFLSELESLTMKFVSTFEGEYTKISFPRRITKLALSEIRLSRADMSIIGELPNLQVLKLGDCVFAEKEWETTEYQFEELKLLKLISVDLEKWLTCSEHFPKLERLVLLHCVDLQEIPTEIGPIPTLEMIELHGCSFEASLSAVKLSKNRGNMEMKILMSSSPTLKGQKRNY